MIILSSVTEMTAFSKAAQRAGKRVGFVPTMGALHDGHLSLVRAARAETAVVVVSIFVNPTQFGPKEDFAQYPRTFERDRAMLEEEGTDCIFSPSVEEMYPRGATTWVCVQDLGEKLDGRSRPGHFRGVSTVVSKLFNIVQPQSAFFGQKDAAQVAIIRKMARDLNFDVNIVVCPIVRERDGLAMSSRNAYLSSEQRRQATVLNRSLKRVQELFEQGETSTEELIAAAKRVIAQEPAVRLDYCEIVDPVTLDPLMQAEDGGLVAVAAYVGPTRLIDNLLLPPRVISSSIEKDSLR
jgi:pantoate--beta-alanine ligase